MANKRMFSLSIVDTDAFLDMPVSSQLLYFHLAMRADDEGFVGNPKRLMRMLGANEDDYKVLVAKKFIVPFESGVAVIKHWLIHNTIRMDRYAPTTYIEEKKQLVLKDNKAYKLVDLSDKKALECGKPIGNHLVTQVKLSKVKLSKVSKATPSVAEHNPMGAEIVRAFIEFNPACSKFYNNKTQRFACDNLIKEYGLAKVLKVIEILPKTNTMQFVPTITTPLQLEDKWASLQSAMLKKKSEHQEKLSKYKVAFS